MTTLKENIRLANGYMAFDHEPLHYNDYNVKGDNPNCNHPTFTEKSGNNAVNKYCSVCGYRRLFIKYAKHIKKGRR